MTLGRVLTAALATHLASLGLVRYPPTGPGSGVPCYVEDMPDAPDNAVCVYSRAGFPAVDMSGYEMPELQVVRRAGAGPVRPVLTHLEQIRRALDQTDTMVWAPSTQDETPVMTCTANEPSPLSLGKDPTGRPKGSVSFQLHLLTEEAAL